MIPTYFHPQAQAELDEAASYEARVRALGIDLRKNVESATRRIQEHPDRWPPFEKQTRRFLIRRFPYSVIYLELRDSIWIVAIAHHKHRPGYWHGRV